MTYGVDQEYAQVDGTGRKVLRRALYIVGIIIVLNLGAAALRPWLDPQTDGPRGSSFVTTAMGVGAWHDVLAELGVQTERIRVPFAEAPVDEATTVVVIDPSDQPLDLGYAAALAGHANRGGRVILIDIPNVARLFDLDLTLATSGHGVEPVVSSAPTFDDVAAVDLSGATLLGGGEPMLEAAERAIITRFSEGSGEIVVVATATPFTNDQLASHDHGVLAVRLIGTGPVAFDEFVHGYAIDQGWQGLGAVLRRVAIVGLVAALVMMWAVGTRLGPIEQVERAFPPPRAAYIDAMGALIARSRDRRAFRRMHRRAVQSLTRVARRHVGLPEHEQRRKAAQQLGLEPADLQLLEARSIDDAPALAGVAAKIERATSRVHVES